MVRSEGFSCLGTEGSHLEFVKKEKVHLRSTGGRQANRTAPDFGSMVQISWSLTLSGDRAPSSSHALGVRRQVFSGWADGGQWQSLVTLRCLQKKTQILT